MSHTNSKPSRGAAFFFLLAVAVSGLSAQASGAADPFSLWDYSDNPGAWSFFPDALAFGVRGAADLSDLSSVFEGEESASWDMGFGVRGLLFRCSDSGASSSKELTAAFGGGGFWGAGIRFRWDESSGAASGWGAQDLGIVLRPSAFASFSLGVDDVFDAAGDGDPVFDLGVALRPLAFDPRLETTLTLSADARFGDGPFRMDGVGARFLLGGWLSLQVRYSLADSSLGAGVALSLSGLESSFALDLPSDGAGGSAVLGQAVRLGRTSRPAERVFGKAVLVIDKPGAYPSSPPFLERDPGFGDEIPIWFDLAVEAILRASSDRSIGALALVEPPLFDSDARAQEFGRALEFFRKSGKPVFVYARSMNRLSYVYAAAGAELVALDPNGMLPLLDVASVSLYFKNLLGKLGIEAYNLQSHDTKTAYNMFTEPGMTDPERAMVERYVRGLAAQSYAALDAARSSRLPGGAAASIAAGPYLDPGKAVQAGLVDRLMYRDEFDEAVRGQSGLTARVNIRSYARERGLSWKGGLAPKVAVVYLSGNIIEGKGTAGRSIGRAAVEYLAQLRENPGVAGVILRVDSGGGSALTSDLIAREVRRIREAGKPVVVSMAGYAASGGYYISACADRILAQEGTVTGSIGVTGLDISVVKMLEKLGVGADGVSASPSGLFGSPVLPRRESDADAERAAILYVYGRFLDVVAQGRKMDRARVDELGKGQIWLGSEAVANGLVDGIGGLDEAKAAMAELLGSDPRFIPCLPGEMDLRRLLGMGSPENGAVGKAVSGALRAADELAELDGGLLYLEPAYLYRPRAAFEDGGDFFLGGR